MKLPFVGGGKVEVEVIEWPSMGPDDLVWKWPNDRIALSSTVVVRPGQAAVFVRDGKIMGVLKEGRHMLSSLNVPWLTDLVEKVPVAGKLVEALKAEIYFVSLTEKRGTFGGKAYAGNRFPLTIRGDYRYKVEDPAVFLKEFVGTAADIDSAYVSNYLRNTVLSRLQKFIGDLPPNDFTETLNVQNKAKAFLTQQFEQLGLKLIDLNLVLEMTPEFERLLPFLAGATDWNQLSEVLRMYTLQQMAQSMGQNTAGAMGLGMGMGMMMPYMMGQPQPMAGMGGYVQPQQATKRCPKCGALVPANAKFCPYCGYKFE